MELNLSDNEFYLYVGILVAIIFALSIGVGYFYVKLKRVKGLQQKQARAYLKKEEERVAFVKESIRTIALAFLQKQCEASEACIRLRMLIDRVDFFNNDDFPILFEMYEEIRGFKTHETRNALSLQQRSNEDKQRFAIEDKYMTSLTGECESLLAQLKAQ